MLVFMAVALQECEDSVTKGMTDIIIYYEVQDIIHLWLCTKAKLITCRPMLGFFGGKLPFKW